jgi:ATP-dependent DNA helicase RecG
LSAVLRPLQFAAKDDFAALTRVQELERGVASALEAMATLAIPPDVLRSLGDLRREFEAHETGTEQAARANRIRRGIDCLTPMATDAWSEAQLSRSVADLPGFGPKRAERLARRDLGRIGDLLFCLPVRYDDRRRLSTLGELQVGRRATFVARVLGSAFSARRGRFRGRVFEAMVGDDSGTVNLKWFRGGDSISKQVQKDVLLMVTGDVKRYRFDKEIIHPEVSVLSTGAESGAEPEAQRSIVPEYPTPDGIHPRGLRRAIGLAVERFADFVPGYLPEGLARKAGLPEPAVALRALHRPDADSDYDELESGRSPARIRLVLEELYLLELGLARRRLQRASRPGTPIAPGPRAAAAVDALPFRLTGAQQRARSEILADLARPHPMNRLLEGDVGCGKTAVAYLAALAVAECGMQTALMAPTELLAEQHEKTLRALAESGAGDPLRIARLTASVPRDEAAATRRGLMEGTLDLVVGTHALLQQSVDFRSLAFAIVDEQHRFGVRQRSALASKAVQGRLPHTLVMTATPIPRTLALTLYGDLDISVIDELPPGRQPAQTLLMRAGEGERISDLLCQTVTRGEQVYVVYPLVAESEKTDLRSASKSADRIRAAFPDFRVDLVHGQLDAPTRNAAMAQFARGETQVLVSTTVIEVGVDVPNASLMIIEHAERFGLAQLHQLRGRVGRGAARGTCVLVARAATEDSEARLSALLETTDGFAIAEADLEIRGPGEFLGTRQHGHLPDLKIANLARDARHIATARDAALDTVARDPGLTRQPELARAVRARWGERLDWIDIG